jgi:hypothetical protein
MHRVWHWFAATVPPIGCAFALAGVATVAQEKPHVADPTTFTGLEIAAHALARTGRPEDVHDVLSVLDALAYPKEKATKLAKACEVEASKAKPSNEGLGEVTRKLRAAAKQLTSALPSLDGESKLGLARVILRLDDSVEEAHVALGHEKDGAAWVTADEQKCRTRRSDIAAALQRVRRLDVDIVVGESRNPLLVELYGRPGVEAKWRDYTFHTAWSAEKTVRILREALRACALSSFLQDNRLELPEGRFSSQTKTWVLTDSKAVYTRAIDAELKAGALDAKAAEDARHIANFFDLQGVGVDCSQTEGELLSALLTYFTPLADGAQSCLKAGHLNWVSMACFGASLPGWAWSERSGAGSGGPVGETSIAESESAKRDREEHLRWVRAGIAGCRSYMTYLVEHAQDPPWSRSMVDQFGKIKGEDLLKSTSVIEFLQELGPLSPLMKATGGLEQAQNEAIYTKALGESLAAFEMRWRAWLLPPRVGLVQRSERQPGKGAAGAKTSGSNDTELLRYLNKLRSQALKSINAQLVHDVTADASLSEGARLHAAYLNRHPEQIVAWPDAHEEYVDHEGFTSAGAWAGSHAVIHPGAKSAQDAIDGWMGTFYHRLPLIDPGLMGIGWGVEKTCAVLDVTSLCAPADRSWEVVWPFDGMTSVPTNFSPEIPNPVPKEDESRFGYPITLQVGLPGEDAQGSEIQMKLEEGKTEVPCYFSSPNHPTNVELAPTNSYCLIPKAPLKPKTQYTVRATWTGSSKQLTWSFKT